jgi:hypothetical protein
MSHSHTQQGTLVALLDKFASTAAEIYALWSELEDSPELDERLMAAYPDGWPSFDEMRNEAWKWWDAFVSSGNYYAIRCTRDDTVAPDPGDV